MASTRSIRQGQIEIGIIEHEGHEYAAYGATVVRRDITAYIKFKRGHYWLTSWAGGTKLDCRSEVIETILGWLACPHVPPAKRSVHCRLCSRRRWDVVSGRVDRRLRRR